MVSATNRLQQNQVSSRDVIGSSVLHEVNDRRRTMPPYTILDPCAGTVPFSEVLRRS